MGQGEAVIDSAVRTIDSTFKIKRRIPLFQGEFTYPNEIPFVISEKADIGIRGKSITKNAPIGSGFDIVLIRN